VLVEATKPLTSVPSYEAWDPILTEAGYTFTLFDGLSRYYVSPDHADLVGKLSYPACALDDYVPARQHCQDRQVEQLSQALSAARQEAIRWRNQSVGYWANAVTRAQKSEAEAEVARSEAARLRSKLVRIRERLEQSRDDRRRLREKVQRLSARIEQLEKRQQADGGVTGRLRAAVKKGSRA
jgi:exonuclease VII large subunit